jgi:CRP/FNR family transcriptional regulator, cyclic AMP receptor protein
MLNSPTSSSELMELEKGRNIVRFRAKQVLFSQGAPADSIFYIQTGSAKITVVSNRGKEATITVLSEGDFIGEEALATEPGLRVATATAMSACTVLKLRRETIIELMPEEKAFSHLLLSFLIKRSMRTQADLVDHLFNCSEKRLARILFMAEAGERVEQETLLPEITQESLAAMIGTTRSRVSFFMNRFRERGFIEYDTRIRVHKSLLNVVLHEQPDS